ncbi:hypothetical protein BM221_009565 [Beauveria bassiana]|uniref:DUF7770 domain-containing protein n=1 Tax=Beauveria bassiana TaxID=176275 RepID=A0A2N6NBR1_BEABA|nr:hypothetical protein BM221_009565 [Beauveria bassiana]
MAYNSQKDTFWLVHDTLYSNGFPRNHPILLQSIRCFHVDALTHVSSKLYGRRDYSEYNDSGPKNQWFLVIEGETLQACLSLQPCDNVRTGGCGTLTLQIMGCYERPPLDLLQRQTYHCLRERLTGKAVLETIFFNGWHKYQMMPSLEPGSPCGRRHHMRAMLYDLQDTGWIGTRSVQDLEISDYLEREYIPGQWTADNTRQLFSRSFPIRLGQFRPDVGRLHPGYPFLAGGG